MALSNAEKQARWRAKRDAEFERLRKAAAATSNAELIEARKEIERLRQENAALKAKRKAPAAKQPPPLPKTAEEWDAHRASAAEAQKAARKAKRAAPPETPVEDEPILREKLERAERLHKADRTRIKTLEATIRYLANTSPPRMSKRLYRQVLGFLHPDRAQDDEMRRNLQKCFQDFSNIKFTFPTDE